jgi:hypothetical protein
MHTQDSPLLSVKRFPYIGQEIVSAVLPHRSMTNPFHEVKQTISDFADS